MNFQNLTSDLLAMIKYFNEIARFPLNVFCINHEKMALTEFGNMSIKSLLVPITDSFLIDQLKICDFKVRINEY